MAIEFVGVEEEELVDKFCNRLSVTATLFGNIIFLNHLKITLKEGICLREAVDLSRWVFGFVAGSSSPSLAFQKINRNRIIHSPFVLTISYFFLL